MPILYFFAVLIVIVVSLNIVLEKTDTRAQSNAANFEIKEWVLKKEKKNIFEQSLSFKKLIKKKNIRKELVFNLVRFDSGWTQAIDQEAWNSFLFWQFSENLSLFSEKEKELIKEVNKNIEKKKKEEKRIY